MTTTPDDHPRMCGDKKPYTTMADANRAARIAYLRREADLRVYACPICGAFHLTKKVKDKKGGRR